MRDEPSGRGRVAGSRRSAVSVAPGAAEAAQLSEPLARLAERRAQRRVAAARRRRRRRLVLVVAVLVVLLSPAFYSYTAWMLQPTSMSLGVRSVEWVKVQPGGTWLVDEIEHFYYSWKAPKKGRPQLKTLPAVGLTRPTTTKARPEPARARHLAAWPPRIKRVFAQPLPGEGVWKPTGSPVSGGPPVLVTSFRTERDYPRVVAYVAWFDHTRTVVAFYPGRYEPPNAAVRGPMMVPYGQRWRLLATFNAGFTYAYGGNGSTDNGRVNEPLKAGHCHPCRLSGRTGLDHEVARRPERGAERGVGTPEPAADRLGRKGQPQSRPEHQVGRRRSATPCGSGAPVSASTGAATSSSSPPTHKPSITLAQIFQHIGAVRAMQFDINPYWHTLITYTHHNGLVPTMVEPQPNHTADRYLIPDDRDFFAVYRRLPGPVTVPFK